MIYLDHAATTPIDKKVIEAMTPFFADVFGNPSALYRLGRQASRAITNARQEIATILNSSSTEIIFTAGGTESDNLAILGIAKQFLAQPQNYHFITTNIEHSAVLNSFKFLEQQGFQVTYLSPDKFGLIHPQDVMKALKPNTVLVSIMYANNEIGTIQPIKEISKVIKNYRHIQQIDKVTQQPIYPIFHTDACQAAGYLELDVEKLGIDLMTLNGSKIYGPKQIGILFKKDTLKLNPILYGGDQEMGLRPGTQNVASIVGIAKALSLVSQHKVKEVKRLEKLRDYFIKQLLQIPDTILNGHPNKRLPNNVNVTFKYIEGESIMLKLDAADIYVSTGSACHAMDLKPSYVVLALGRQVEDVHGSMRFTMGQSTTKKDIDKTVKVLRQAVKELRAMTAINH